jgi:hypothetical protein
LERHGNHVGSSAFLVFRGVLPLVAVADAIVTVFLLLMQGYGCSCEISACVVIGGSVIAGDVYHLIKREFVRIHQAGKLVSQQPSTLQATNEGVHCCAVIYVLALVSGRQPSGEETSGCFTLLLDAGLKVACGGRSLVDTSEVVFEGLLQVKPAKDGVFLEVAEPNTSWTNKVQLEHAAGYIRGSSGKGYCIVVILNPGIRPLAAIIMLQISG